MHSQRGPAPQTQSADSLETDGLKVEGARWKGTLSGSRRKLEGARSFWCIFSLHLRHSSHFHPPSYLHVLSTSSRLSQILYKSFTSAPLPSDLPPRNINHQCRSNLENSTLSRKLSLHQQHLTPRLKASGVGPCMTNTKPKLVKLALHLQPPSSITKP